MLSLSVMQWIVALVLTVGLQESRVDTAPFKLEGVIVSSPPSQSVALVRREGTRWAKPVRVGETAYGMRLVEVGDAWADFEQEGVRTRLVLARLAPSRDPIAPRSGIEIQPEGGSRTPAPPEAAPEPRVVDRDTIESRLSKEMPVILAETRLVPQMVDGAVHGYRILQLPETSVLAELGIAAGDVVVSVNGQIVDGLPMLISLYPSVLSRPEIVVGIERGGEPLTLALRLR